jgi:hypothetical protein
VLLFLWLSPPLLAPFKGLAINLREQLEGVGIGCDDFVQYHEEFNRLATDPDIELLGSSDGSLSGDYTNGGYGWVVAVKEHASDKLKALAGGGGAARVL